MPIDQYIVQFSGAIAPKLLFIPTASGDAHEYIETMKNVYGGKLGCEVDALLLVDKNISQIEIERKILSADIIYVGGGNTMKMMDIWRSRKIDEYLLKAYSNNAVLSGLSAGSICWFQKGYSDSMSFTSPDGQWDYIQVTGVGLIPAIHCPHYNEKGREEFDIMMKSEELSGIAMENNCAIVINNDMYRIIKADNNRRAYLLRNINGIVDKTELNTIEFSRLSEIL